MGETFGINAFLDSFPNPAIELRLHVLRVHPNTHVPWPHSQKLMFAQWRTLILRYQNVRWLSLLRCSKIKETEKMMKLWKRLKIAEPGKQLHYTIIATTRAATNRMPCSCEARKQMQAAWLPIEQARRPKSWEKEQEGKRRYWFVLKGVIAYFCLGKT